MRIGIDVDGVICDQTTGALNVLNKRYSTSIKRDDINSWWYVCEKLNITTTEFLGAMDEAYRTGDVYLEEDAIPAVIKRMRKLKHHVSIMTRRTFDSHAATVKWVQEQGIVYDSFIFVGNETKLKYPIDVLLDDSPSIVEQAVEHAATGVRVFLRDQTWNRGVASLPWNVTRVSGVVDFLDAIERMERK